MYGSKNYQLSNNCIFIFFLTNTVLIKLSITKFIEKDLTKTNKKITNDKVDNIG
jgi:hypothetical protein